MRCSSTATRTALALACNAALACVGSVAAGPDYAGGPVGGGADIMPGRDPDPAAASGGATTDTPPGWPSFGPSTPVQLRRLTVQQYANTVRTLLRGTPTTGMPPIEGITQQNGFGAIAASRTSVSPTGVSQFEDAARFLAHAAVASPALRQGIVPCAPSGPADTACFQAFVSAFGKRAFRRPLAPEEVARYAAFTAAAARDTGDPWLAIEATVGAFLQSPSFLYLVELGRADPQSPGRVRYTSHELASRLSYFLTDDMPDDALLAAADMDALATPEGVRAQAARLLGLQAARDAAGAFWGELLGLAKLMTLSRDKKVFPAFTQTLGPAMRDETLRVLDDLVFASDADYRDLLVRRDTFVNVELAALYGLPRPSAAGFQRTPLPAGSPRLGLLGQAGVLATRDHPDATSPTSRGLFVLTALLCKDLPLTPPADVMIPPLPAGKMTARQKFAAHDASPCAVCHRFTDPVGLSLEHFDAVGAWRDTDQGLPIDDAGQLEQTSYAGAAGLAALLRDHPALGPCLAQSLYGVAVGHAPTEFDQPTFGALVKAFAAGGYRVRALLTAIATSDGFRTGTAAQP